MTPPPARIGITLLSDTTFARGEPTPGEVDIEVDHDDLGLPFAGGKTLHGLLRESWALLRGSFADLEPAGFRVLGQGRDHDESCILRIGNAQVDEATRAWVIYARSRPRHPLAAADVLGALTDVRVQTSQERTTGGPAVGTLRASRVVRRGLSLSAPLAWLNEPDASDLGCLALAALGVRHAGYGRNRGRGHVQLLLDGDRALTLALARAVLQP